VHETDITLAISSTDDEPETTGKVRMVVSRSRMTSELKFSWVEEEERGEDVRPSKSEPEGCAGGGRLISHM
jgi:hypothetical protein